MLPPEPERTILHVDANCFFVSCHVAAEPARLRGRPVVVGGDPARRAGIVLSASYEARAAGVRTAMPLGEALRLCPDLTVLPAEMLLYRQVSSRLHGLFADYTPLVERFSVDEAWLDMTGCGSAGGLRTAQTIAKRVAEELDLPVSVGIGPNKLLAKMASGLRKPRGILELNRADVPTRLWPLPAATLFGVGPALAARLTRWNVRTIGDLAALGPRFCERNLGQTGTRLWRAAHGRDDTPVEAGPGQPKSVGCSTTLGRDVRGLGEARPVLLQLAERVAGRLRERDLVALAVSVTLRDAGFAERRRSRALPGPSNDGTVLFRTALELASPSLQTGTRFRLFGISAARVAPTAGVIRQPSIWEGPASASTARRQALLEATDQVRKRFGENALLPALLAPTAHHAHAPRQTG